MLKKNIASILIATTAVSLATFALAELYIAKTAKHFIMVQPRREH